MHATRAALEAASREITVMIAPNTSLGVALLTQLAAIAARSLGADYDNEIHEAHHRMKRDAPSGTALQLGAVIAVTRFILAKHPTPIDFGRRLTERGSIRTQSLLTFSFAEIC